MLVTIRQKPAEILVQTITLSHDFDHPDDVLFVRCFRCGGGIDQVQGKISMVSPGLIHGHEVPIIHHCGKCGENYVFHTQDTPRTVVRLILTPRLGRNLFYCLKCRSQIFIYQDNTAYPQTICCPTCALAYKIADVL